MTADQPQTPLTAFPQTEASLRRQLAQVPVHADSFRRPLARCSLAHCRGMCCHDGIYVEDEEARIVKRLARREADFFRDLGLTLPRRVIVTATWKGLVSGKKTAVAPRPFSTLVEDFPAHFSDTACVFLAADGRCGLQVLSEARGLHPWYYKPTGCWLHPLSLDHGGSGALGLSDENSDPFRLPGYDGFVSRTFCGRTASGGQPAGAVLRDELEFLGRIVGRDFVAEVAAAPLPEEDAPSGRLSLKVLPES